MVAECCWDQFEFPKWEVLASHNKPLRCQESLASLFQRRRELLTRWDAFSQGSLSFLGLAQKRTSRQQQRQDAEYRDRMVARYWPHLTYYSRQYWLHFLTSKWNILFPVEGVTDGEGSGGASSGKEQRGVNHDPSSGKNKQGSKEDVTKEVVSFGELFCLQGLTTQDKQARGGNLVRKHFRELSKMYHGDKCAAGMRDEATAQENNSGAGQSQQENGAPSGTTGGSSSSSGTIISSWSFGGGTVASVRKLYTDVQSAVLESPALVAAQAAYTQTASSVASVAATVAVPLDYVSRIEAKHIFGPTIADFLLSTDADEEDYPFSGEGLFGEGLFASYGAQDSSFFGSFFGSSSTSSSTAAPGGGSETGSSSTKDQADSSTEGNDNNADSTTSSGSSTSSQQQASPLTACRERADKRFSLLVAVKEKLLLSQLAESTLRKTSTSNCDGAFRRCSKAELDSGDHIAEWFPRSEVAEVCKTVLS
ncbi:unnamed protein product [Amoebophrya sp. A25]|nr:unnamed protein product [Amoebophrya sp. A25]|eukprot:GSA25T00016690001.1